MGLGSRNRVSVSKLTQPLWTEKELIIVDYEVLFNPSKRHKANALTKFGAIDVAIIVLSVIVRELLHGCFPIQNSFSFIDDCCKKMVKFVPKEEE